MVMRKQSYRAWDGRSDSVDEPLDCLDGALQHIVVFGRVTVSSHRPFELVERCIHHLTLRRGELYSRNLHTRPNAQMHTLLMKRRTSMITLASTWFRPEAHLSGTPGMINTVNLHQTTFWTTFIFWCREDTSL